MLRKLKIRDFKSIREADVGFPQLTVLFGPNAAGKSNLLDAIQALSRVTNERTISDALSEPIRGHPIESFAFPSGGLGQFLGQDKACFLLEADLEVKKELFRYRVEVAIQPRSGSLSVTDEYLAVLSKKGDVKGSPSIEPAGGQILVRRRTTGSRPRYEMLGQNHTIVSDPSLIGPVFRQVEHCRREMAGWRIYYLDPRVAMRAAKPPAEVSDIGVLGENIAPFLYRLRAEKPKDFEAVRRTLCSVVPDIEHVDVDLDKRRGTLEILIRQNGIDFSSRIISEGTLRVLALCAIAVNPWGGSLVAFEEPENGVHPRRLMLIAQLLISLATERQTQVIVTTHSPLFCQEIVNYVNRSPATTDVLERPAILNVRQEQGTTVIRRLGAIEPLFADTEIQEGLAEKSEGGSFSALVKQGLIGG